jgi:hypothetical protein
MAQIQVCSARVAHGRRQAGGVGFPSAAAAAAERRIALRMATQTLLRRSLQGTRLVSRDPGHVGLPVGRGCLPRVNKRQCALRG